MVYNSKLYYVIPLDMAAQLNFEAVEEPTVEYVRTNVAGTLCIVEYKGTTVGGSYLTHAEALELMATPEWSVEAPEP